MKKVEIMLNINDQEPEIVLQRLLKYLNRNRFCIIVFMLEMIIQGFGAVFFTLLDKDILTNMVTVKACTIFMMINNVFIFFFLSYLVFFFLKMGYFFVKYVSANDSSINLRTNMRRANITFALICGLMLLSFFYNYILNSLPLLQLIVDHPNN